MIKLLAKPKAVIGTSLTKFEEKYPIMVKQQYEDEVTFSEKFRVTDLDVSWLYWFKKEELEWIYMHKYIQQVNQENFDKCLKMTREIIAGFTLIYGKADSEEIVNATYISPLKRRHWGYDVMRAVWKNHTGMKIKVRFTFKGGKGDYSFLVSIDYHDKDYPF